jgi:2-phospho-L-lactate/phosphoenolpyruvate guanylyltransferase
MEAVLVPMKAFDQAKVRLAPALPPQERTALARRMAEHVLAAARPLLTAVACDDQAVADWAVANGALVVWTPGRGLNGAVADGVVHLASLGAARVIVAHGDLPLASDLARVARFPGVTLVPDRHGDGTNVACVPSDSGFTFSYGPRSFERHRVEARRLDLPLHVARIPSLGWDVDLPADLAAVAV